MTKETRILGKYTSVATCGDKLSICYIWRDNLYPPWEVFGLEETRLIKIDRLLSIWTSRR